MLDKKDSSLKRLHGTLDSQYHNLPPIGLGREVKHARVLSEDYELKRWKSGVLSIYHNKLYRIHCWKDIQSAGGVEMR